MSKKLENPILTIIIYFGVFFLITLILWPLLDLLISAVFTHSEFHYNFNDYVIEPLIFSVIFTLIFCVPPIIKSNKKKK